MSSSRSSSELGRPGKWRSRVLALAISATVAFLYGGLALSQGAIGPAVAADGFEQLRPRYPLGQEGVRAGGPGLVLEVAAVEAREHQDPGFGSAPVHLGDQVEGGRA